MKGERVPISLPRRFVNDLLAAARGVPTVPVQRTMHLGVLATARSQMKVRPSWCSLFLLALARVAKDMPELRRAYMKFPWAYLYQYPVSVANIALEREYKGERGVFVARIKDPASLTIPEAHDALHYFTTVPIEECKDFRRALRISRWPWPMRRVAWWVALNVPRQRGNYVGTYGVSVYSGLGAASLHPISPCTTTLTYGVIDPGGLVDVRLVYDHRVLDGSTVARALDYLEAELTGPMVAEMEQMQRPSAVMPPLRVAV